jgi:hypothetical protein
MARKRPQHDVDRIRAALSEDDRAEFDKFCTFNPTYSDIQRRLSELGYPVSMSAIQAWYSVNYPRGEEAVVLNDLAAKYRGADPYAVLQMSMTIAAKLADTLLEKVNEKLDQASPENVLHTLSNLLREQRTCATVLHELQTTRDRKALELAGGYRVAEILRTNARNTAQAAIIDELIDAAIAQLEQEVNG